MNIQFSGVVADFQLYTVYFNETGTIKDELFIIRYSADEKIH